MIIRVLLMPEGNELAVKLTLLNCGRGLNGLIQPIETVHVMKISVGKGIKVKC